MLRIRQRAPVCRMRGWMMMLCLQLKQCNNCVFRHWQTLRKSKSRCSTATIIDGQQHGRNGGPVVRGDYVSIK